jgi:hypothetical protein
MADRDQPLSDNEVGDRLYAALEALGQSEAETVRGQTSLEAARRALRLIQVGLLVASEGGTDEVVGVIQPET